MLRRFSTLFRCIAIAITSFATAASAASYDAVKQSFQAQGAQLRKTWALEHPGVSPETEPSPKILSGKLGQSVDVQSPPAAPEITVKFKTGADGLAYVNAFFSGPHSQYAHSVYTSSDHPTSGTLVIRDATTFGQYSQPGTWLLTDVDVVDTAGRETSYNGSGLMPPFTTITFTLANANGLDDSPATMKSGIITTPTVRLSSVHPVFAADLSVSDVGTGVASATVAITDAGGGGYIAVGEAESPIKHSGTVHVGIDLAQVGASPGIATITEVTLTDEAKNVTFISDPAQLMNLFGTVTFQINP